MEYVQWAIVVVNNTSSASVEKAFAGADAEVYYA